MRRTGLLGLTVWVAAMAVLAPSASACVWCDSDQWLDFQDCLYWKILNEPSFQQIPAGALEDMRESVLAASRASTKRTGSSMKMKMIVGAMGGELSEMIKPLPNYARSKAVLMDVVQVCNVDATGRPDSTFIDELSKTLDFMLDLPSYDNPESVPGNNDAFPRDEGQYLTNPANVNGQIINSSPNFNNMRQPQPEQILPSAGSIQNNAAPYPRNNQQAQSGIAVQNNLNAGSGLPAQVVTGQSNVNVVDLSYPSQPQITNTNGANGINTFNQNPSTNPSIINANAASSSYLIAQNANSNPGSRPYPLNPGYFNQPQVTNANAASSANLYNLGSATTISNTGQNIPQNSIPNQYPLTDFSIINNQQPNNPINNLQNQQIPTQSINQPQSSFIGSGAKTFETNAQNVPQNYQGNQFNQYPASNLNELGQNSGSVQRQTNQNNDGASPNSGLSPNNDYWLQSQGYPNNPALNTPYASSSGSSAATNSNLQSFVTQDNRKFPVNYPAVTNRIRKIWGKLQNRTPDLNKQQQNNINGVKNQKSLKSSPIDDDVARAMRFVETFYVIVSQSNTFKRVFNEQVPNDKALSLVYEIDVGALNDCGYSQFSDEIANACAVSIQSLPDGISSEQYAEALSKTIMDQLNMKKLIRQNPEDQAKCIANNLLTRLQKIYPLITTTFAPPLLADNRESTLNQGPGSESQLTNANSGSYSSYQNSDIQTQSMNSNGARIYRPNVNQNIPRSNLQNQFSQGNDVPINNAVRSNLINKPQNQLNFGPGPMKQQTGSSAIATNKNIGTNLNFQNTDQTYNEDGMNNAATIFNQKLINDLLTCPDMSRIYNEGTTKTNAETVTATLLLVSLSADYANLATEIARESIRRLGSLPTGSNTEAYITLIATSITDGFSYYGLLSQEAPLTQASGISSNIIDWLKGDTNSGNNNQQANINIDAQSNLPNQNAVNYADSYSSVPNLIQGQQAAASEILALNSGGIADYNTNTENLGPQYLQYDNQNLGSNSLRITNDGLQNVRTFSDANSSSVNTNINKDKDANENNKQKSKKPKKKTTVSKTNFNFDNLNDYPVNKAVKSKQNSSPDISNGNSFRIYNDNAIYLPNNVPNTQWSGLKNYPAQNVNTDYDLTSGTAIIQNDNISGIQQSALPSSINKSPRKKICKQPKIRKVNNAANKPFIGDNYAGPPSNDYGIIPNQNTPTVPTQSQIIPDESNNEVKERIRYLTKGVLSSLTSGKFDYKLFSDIIAEVSQNLQTTHPGLGSQTSLIKTLIDSIIACTQLLKKVPSNYFDDIGLRQNSDIPDAEAIDYSNSISPVQEDKITIQTNQDNVALNDQSNQLLTLPQQSTNNLNNAQIEDFYPGGSVPLSSTNVPPPRQGSVNNVALNDQSYGLQNLPQQNNLNNDQVGNFYPGDSAPLSLRQGSMNNVLQQNNLNNAQTENFYPGDLPPQPNTNVLPPRQGAVNNVDIVNNDQNYGSPNLLQNNLNMDQTGQGNFYPGDSAPLLNPNVQPTRPIFEIQSLSQGIGGNGFSNAQTFRGISSQIGQDDSPPLLNEYGGENLQLNNQNGLAFQSSRGFNNPNLKPGSMGNQNIPPGNLFQTELSQNKQMYDTNLPMSNQMSNLEEAQIQDKLAKISLIGRLLRK